MCVYVVCVVSVCACLLFLFVFFQIIEILKGKYALLRSLIIVSLQIHILELNFENFLGPQNTK